MSEPNKIALYVALTIEPFAPMPTFTPNGEPLGWITWGAANVAPMIGEGLETVLLWVSSDTTDIVHFTAASALADALADEAVLFRFEANRCPACKGETVAYDGFRWGPCLACGGTGRIEAATPGQGDGGAT